MGQPGATFEMAQHRIERAVGVVGRALQADFSMRFDGDAGKHSFAETGFAETGLT